MFGTQGFATTNKIILNNMDISNLSVEALKAMAYDEFLRVQVSQKNLEIINAEISVKQKESEKAEETKKEDPQNK